MTMEMEVMHSSQQDMNLIDILWKQDIDLGARREVFDYNHRQKEHELQRQLELEEEKRLHLLREQEKALLAQLQLDEETGEYIPCPPPSAPLQSAITPLEVTQNVGFTEDNRDAMSFDECLQLLAETFPVEETENTSVCLDTTSVAMMSPEQPALPLGYPLPRPTSTITITTTTTTTTTTTEDVPRFGAGLDGAFVPPRAAAMLEHAVGGHTGDHNLSSTEQLGITESRLHFLPHDRSHRGGNKQCKRLFCRVYEYI
ncbi:Nuclear factor erythroid 2-related factor 2 [Larimichthys crocea]|uniref:Uncharacterized protein n=1 Tax=Larimichthys crocea TaxID=215358 RepID=A0ACD3QHR4_LARCR|nr:Nuclear factor erythroid 2-related factor 2 [Larimichthys crocea]